jgi:hypothetical protein
MNANTTETREVTADELRTVEGGIAGFIPGLNPVVTLAAKETTAPRSSAQHVLAVRSDEYVRNYG